MIRIDTVEDCAGVAAGKGKYMKKIKWGIVGPGVIANKFADAIKNVDCAELTAVASRSMEKGEQFAQKYDVGKVFCGYEAMAASNEVDAVYVATPHPFHKPCAELFLKAGKHVLCEKPLCINAAQGIALRECARENGVFLMEAMWTRFLPATKEARAIVESGAIGEVLGLTADFCYASSPLKATRIFRQDLAGGSLLDVGVYGLHFVSLFLGTEPEQIHAVSRIEQDVDCHTKILLTYGNGAIAEVSSAITLKKPESAYIYGTKGYIHLPLFFGAKELFVTIDGKTEHLDRPMIGKGFEEEIIEACDCIRAGKTESDILPLSESIAILRQMDSVRKQIGLRYPFEGEESI